MSAARAVMSDLPDGLLADVFATLATDALACARLRGSCRAAIAGFDAAVDLGAIPACVGHGTAADSDGVSVSTWSPASLKPSSAVAQRHAHSPQLRTPTGSAGLDALLRGAERLLQPPKPAAVSEEEQRSGDDSGISMLRLDLGHRAAATVWASLAFSGDIMRSPALRDPRALSFAEVRFGNGPMPSHVLAHSRIRRVAFVQRHDGGGRVAIGASCLAMCSDVESVDFRAIAGGITSVAADFLAQCVSLRALDFTPFANTTDIGPGCCAGCATLERAVLSPMTRLRALPTQLFAGCKALVRVDCSGMEALEAFGSDVFAGCTALEEVSFGPAGLPKVHTIGAGFGRGSGLVAVDFTTFTNLRTIGSHFLAACARLQRAEMDGLAALERVDGGAFAGSSPSLVVRAKGVRPALRKLLMPSTASRTRTLTAGGRCRPRDDEPASTTTLQPRPLQPRRSASAAAVFTMAGRPALASPLARGSGRLSSAGSGSPRSL